MLGELLKDSGSFLCLSVVILDLLWRMYEFMTCIFWSCMLYIRCDCWEILYMHVVLRSIEDVTSISWIIVLFTCFIALIEIWRYRTTWTRTSRETFFENIFSMNDWRPNGRVFGLGSSINNVRRESLMGCGSFIVVGHEG